jgi:hypothetical protein
MLVAIFGQRVVAVLCASGFHLICTGCLFGVGFGGWPVAASVRAGLSRDALPIEINVKIFARILFCPDKRPLEWPMGLKLGILFRTGLPFRI